jgi:hypothetical protein
MNSRVLIVLLAATLAVPVSAGEPGSAAGSPAPGGGTAPATSPAPASPAAPTAPTTPATPPSPAAPSTAASAISKDGLEISADIREEYLAGLPMLVEVTVRNPTKTPHTFPDLSARSHLVHFEIQLPTHKTERFTTPPQFDSPAAWSLAPGSQRRVLLEIPASNGFDPGTATLGVQVLDPAGTVEIAARPIRIAPPAPVGGSVTWEPTISTTTGGMVVWLHKAAAGFDLYLHQFNPKTPKRLLAHYRLAHLDAQVDPVLSRARASEALARWIYWKSGPQTYTFSRLAGPVLPEKPRTVAVPWPQSELLGTGVTDAKGGLVLPLWIPAPKGTAGTIRALCIDAHGALVIREVADLPARPKTVATTVDAAGALELAIGHDAGIDLYKIDPTAPTRLPAQGVRVTKLTDGWVPGALAFDTLPDRPQHAGGLALFALVRHPGDAATYRTFWADLGGKPFDETQPLPWTAPGDIADVLPPTAGPAAWLTRDTTGAAWYGVQGGPPATKVDNVPPRAALWTTADTVMLRALVPGVGVADRELGPKPH